MANIDSSTILVAVTLSESAAVAEQIYVEANLPTDCPEKVQAKELEQEEAADADEKEVNKECIEDQDTEDTELLQDDVVTEESVEKEADDTETVAKEPVEAKTEDVAPEPIENESAATKRSVEEKFNEEVVASKKLKTDSEQANTNDGIVCEE